MEIELATFKYYSVDWIAMLFTFAAIYLLGNKSKFGFPIMMAGNACWIVIGIFTGSVAMIIANLGLFLMNTRGWYKWSDTSQAG